MKKFISASWIIFCYMVFAGCTQHSVKGDPQENTGPRFKSSSSVVRPGQTDMLLKYMQIFNAMSAEKQKRELASVVGLRRTEYNRMQLILIYGMPGSRFRDVSRAQSLLDEHLKAADSKDDGLRSLATLLKSQLNEQQKLVIEQQKLEDTASQMTQKLKDEQKKSETLQRKLDELIAVEKAMTDRIQAPVK
jgi:predicted ribosome quality control (RQC) complex YloA/Tae2 family protein